MPAMLSTKLNARQKQMALYLVKEQVNKGDIEIQSHFSQANADPLFLQYAACFVTLTKNNRLRGCMGSLEARRTLFSDLCCNAYAAAYTDPRFPAVKTTELSELSYHISILSPPKHLPCESRQDLLDKLRVGIDGLIIKEGVRSATFLPSVWKTLPEKTEFIAHLMTKAGLPKAHWSENLKVSTYQCQEM